LRDNILSFPWTRLSPGWPPGLVTDGRQLTRTGALDSSNMRSATSSMAIWKACGRRSSTCHTTGQPPVPNATHIAAYVHSLARALMANEKFQISDCRLQIEAGEEEATKTVSASIQRRDASPERLDVLPDLRLLVSLVLIEILSRRQAEIGL
jgi:hypothetical protein